MIRSATVADANAIWQILEPTIRAGDTYALDRDLNKEDALNYWMNEQHLCYVMTSDSQVLGTYYLRPNNFGGGRHVANCGYMVRHDARGRGIARKMCEHSIETARKNGFNAMQFNFVVSTNSGAIGLWHSLGFETIGRLPGAFEHPTKGLVDALVMFRKL